MRNLFVPVMVCVILFGLNGARAEAPTPDADLNGDGSVNMLDLLLLAEQWDVGERYTPTPTETPFTPTPTATDTPTQAPPEITFDVPELAAGAKPLIMVRIPAGSFLMGATDDSSWTMCPSCEQPVHEVNIGYDFYIGKYEVTQAQWKAVMKTNPAEGYGYGFGDDSPVYFVSWTDCGKFIAALNLLGKGTFRLPSEAEWEYACRAGTTTRYYFGDSNCTLAGCAVCELDLYGWYCSNSPNGSKVVGRKLPNDFGLYDMHGNLWEWCQDWWHGGYDNNYDGTLDAPVDGSAWEAGGGTYRVLRGGSWYNSPRSSRSADRIMDNPDWRFQAYGLRLVMTPEP